MQVETGTGVGQERNAMQCAHRSAKIKQLCA